jgi:hypothetical protein
LIGRRTSLAADNDNSDAAAARRTNDDFLRKDDRDRAEKEVGNESAPTDHWTV